MLEKILRKHSVQVVVFLIWFLSVFISSLLTVIIMRITIDENYMIVLTIACAAATVASLSTSIPTTLVYKKIINMKDGAIIKELLPGQELIGRFGGEEFIVVLHDITKEQASIIGEKIRRELNSNIVYNEKEINFAVSVGIVHTSQCKLDADSLIKIADDNLYITKKNGRNSISIKYI